MDVQKKISLGWYTMPSSMDPKSSLSLQHLQRSLDTFAHCQEEHGTHLETQTDVVTL